MNKVAKGKQSNNQIPSTTPRIQARTQETEAPTENKKTSKERELSKTVMTELKDPIEQNDVTLSLEEEKDNFDNYKLKRIIKTKKGSRINFRFECLIKKKKEEVPLEEIPDIKTLETILRTLLFDKNGKRNNVREVPNGLLSETIEYFCQKKNVMYIGGEGRDLYSNSEKYLPDLTSEKFNPLNLSGRLFSISEDKYVLKFRFDRKTFFCLENDFKDLHGNAFDEKIGKLPYLGRKRNGLVSLNKSFIRGNKNIQEIIQRITKLLNFQSNNCLSYALENIFNFNFKKAEIEKIKRKKGLEQKINYINSLGYDFEINLPKKEEKIGFLEDILEEVKENIFILAFGNADDIYINHCVGIRQKVICGSDEKFESGKGKFVKYYIINLKINLE